MKVDNAIIMAAGTSSRFAPLSYEKHKAMTIVKGEVLIERQIKQLKESGVSDIYIVTGYKAEQFNYLTEKYGTKLIHNSEYLTRNNNGSIWAARNILANSYVCSSDNYFSVNPFESEIKESYYAAEYSDGPTSEWCMTEGEDGFIDAVTIGGTDAWYMLGHTFWSEKFSSKFIDILSAEYSLSKTADKLWESIFVDHLDVLKMKIKRYAPNTIYEFDTLDELRIFDKTYITNSHSRILKKVAKEIGISEEKMIHVKSFKGINAEAVGFEFDCPVGHYKYTYATKHLEKT